MLWILRGQISLRKNNKKIFLFLLINSFSVVQAASSISHDTNVDDLFQNLKKRKASTLLTAVQSLDQQFFRKENHILIFDSMSPQGSSNKSPRIVLFGKNKELRIGFSPHHQSGQNFDIIQWRDVTKTWEFREISFSKHGPHLSEANPSICMQCHRDHKPKITDSYLDDLYKRLKPQIDTAHFFKLKAKDPIYKNLIDQLEYKNDSQK